MILAAGRGERMRPLTDSIPKPLLAVAGETLLERHIHALAKAGIHDIIINHSWLGEQIVARLGDGSEYGVNITYSHEDSALETAGGISRALPMLGADAFIVVNGDIWTDFDFADLTQGMTSLAHLVLVANAPHHPQGDFGLQADQVITQTQQRYTFSGIGLYHPDVFANLPEPTYPLGKLLRSLITNKQVTGELYTGQWFDIGTPERLEQINQLQLTLANG